LQVVAVARDYAVNAVELFGIPLRNVSLGDAVSIIARCLENESSNSVFFLNAHAVNLARDDPEYREIFRRATHVFADGIGVRIAGILAGRRLVGNVATDWYPHLCGLLQGTDVRIFLLGGEPGIAERARDRTLLDFPSLTICGVHHGHFPDEEGSKVIAGIREAKTDLLLVGMGMPKQERWVATNLEATGVKVAIVVGALFDYWSGKRKRAPVWMRRMGLEWFGRLIPGRGEPRRLWRRYLLGNFRFLGSALAHGIRERRMSRHSRRM
jgi:N-acetylglucosaminyldiphosphoundecaprenol N-acetyl-beta-D-mannosaminyltransferase